MIVYATHAGGRYLPIEESLREQPEGKRAVYINITNDCNCDCVFCLRSMKEMAKESSLWIERDPSVEEIIAELDRLPWEYVCEVVCCGFGEPLIRLDTVLAVLRRVKEQHPDVPTRVNTNGLGELEHGCEFAERFAGLLDTISISLNASNAERYLALTRSKFGISSYEAMLAFAEHCKPYVPNVVLTVVEKVENEEEIALCRKICAERGLTLRVRTYEDS
ncbi:radical SAM domain protein [Selenomonas sp. oral taxon 892 str. F0426]|uniref:TatD family nuclease-associated radical SAM protein n=1 Tax=Selenomonas sp. oral taxon 892 TaxID=1321785 RepID=UPI0003AD73D4|nr:TatD family nuclease-associated radical SAM protein [Selenomonas sp. oral taxon 892]ERJ92693.1 radical SAM domain protein [Selenomonas sp. oral taxon 892 str. F0426]